METIEDTLLAMKERALQATQNRDGDFYRNYLADDAIAIVPLGVFDKNAIVKMMSSAESPFRSVGIEDTKAIVLDDNTGVVTYKAIYESNQDKKRFAVYVTTVYAKRFGSWKGVLYQQTPLREH